MKFRTLLYLATLFALCAGYWIKHPCVVGEWGDRREFHQLCYNDIQTLFHSRNLDEKRFPYVEERSYEYPVVMGLLLWTASLVSEDKSEFFYANLLLLSLAALLTTYALIQGVGAKTRVLLFASGSPLVLYAFLNLDLYAVACVALALWAWRAKRIFWVGAAIGAGISAKLYPAFLLPALLVALWQQHEGEVAPLRQLIVGSVVSFAFFNVPVILADFLRNGNVEGWLGFVGFHASRPPDFGTVWFWLGDFFTQEGPLSNSFRKWVDSLSPLLFGAGSLLLLAHQWRSKRDPWAIGGSTIALYLLVSKIHSPQHSLWMVPLLVAAPVHPWILASYLCADALVFVSVFSWYGDALGPTLWKHIFIFAVFARAASLLAILGWYLRSRRPSSVLARLRVKSVA